MKSESPLWFALTVKPRYEKAVARALRGKNLEEFLPLYRQDRAWSDRVKAVEFPLFSGYVFCRFSYADRFAVLNTPGVTAILGAGAIYAPIPDDEIAAIRTVVNSGLRARPWPYLVPGQMVRIESGPLAGVRGTVLRNKGVTCVVVTVELLQRSIAAEVDRGAVQPAGVLTSMYAGRSCSA